MKQLRSLSAFILAAVLFGCAAIQQAGLPSPEAQIAAGAQAATAATATATVLLREQKITVPQAKSYRAMLGAAAESLNDANADLVACRAATGSTERTSPDPCWPKVADVLTIALENIGSIRKTVEARR